MTQRPRTTILLLAGDRLARMDISTDDVAGGWLPDTSAAGIPAAAALAAAIQSGGRPAPDTWILTTEAYTQDVSLPPAQILGLDGARLSQALAFEVEPFSGIPATASALGHVASGAGQFRIVQLPAAERDSLIRAALAAGAKRVGIAAVDSPPASDDALRDWLPGIMRELEAGTRPVLRAAPRAPSPHRFLHAGLALAAAAAGIVMLDATTMKHSLAAARALDENHSRAAADIATAKRREDDARRRIDNVEKSTEARQQLTGQGRAIWALLTVLAKERPEDLVIRALDAEGSGVQRVRGLALDPAAIDALATAMAKNLGKAGWSARADGILGLKTLPNGGPWEFTLALERDIDVAAKRKEMAEQ